MDITQIITLTDFDTRLQFITFGLDCYIRILEFDYLKDGDDPEKVALINEEISNGQIINATSIPGTTGFYAVSTLNEETEDSYIQIWRRKNKRELYGPYENMVLDLKPCGKDTVCFPDPNKFC